MTVTAGGWTTVRLGGVGIDSLLYGAEPSEVARQFAPLSFPIPADLDPWRESEPNRNGRQDCCDARRHGFVCTRAVGHVGSHVARDAEIDGNVYDRWPQEASRAEKRELPGRGAIVADDLGNWARVSYVTSDGDWIRTQYVNDGTPWTISRHAWQAGAFKLVEPAPERLAAEGPFAKAARKGLAAAREAAESKGFLAGDTATPAPKYEFT
ncbi:MAG TPA: hypothetical protein VK540_15965, partial [Polyangiaceae bacterium]|nr:hypothetical protein [Polyangiaceae bacterium]